MLAYVCNSVSTYFFYFECYKKVLPVITVTIATYYFKSFDNVATVTIITFITACKYY